MTAEEYRRLAGAANPSIQSRGKQNHDRGRQLEELVEAACAWYRERNLADIEKTPEPMKILGRQESGRFLACYTRKAQPDFKGTLQGGRAVVLEAKNTDTGRITQDRVSPAQWAALDRHESLGAAVFVLVSFQLERFYRIPWRVWKSMKTAFGRKYAKPEDLEPFAVPIRGGVLRFLEQEDSPGTVRNCGIHGEGGRA